MLLFKDPKYLFIVEVTWRGEWAEVLVDGFFSTFIQLKHIGVPKYSTHRCSHKSCGITVQNTVKQKKILYNSTIGVFSLLWRASAQHI